MPVNVSLYAACFLVFLVVLLASWVVSDQKNRSASKLPPGPTGTLFAGVKHLLPAAEPWKTYFAWSQHFDSPVISFRVFNKRIVVLNDYRSVQALLDNRAAIYSDRPMSWMYNVICGRGNAIFNISATNPRHKAYRRLLSQGLGTRGTKLAWPILQNEVDTLLDGLSNAPNDWEQHLLRATAGIVMKVAFGYDIKSLDDPFIKVSEETSKISGWATTPGRWLVDYIPSLRHIPSWFPGTAWKRQGLVWRERLTHLSDVPHQWVKEQMNMGRGTESFTARLLSQLAEEEQDVIKAAETEDIIKWCAGALYAGAAHTTVSALTSFLLLMALHPDIQQKAQEEVDQLFKYVGVFDTVCLSKLHYLRATMKEVLRYAPVANLALPHCVTQEDEYLGYRIPKGATILPNVWAIMHDPTLYPDPFTFSPERFMPLDGDADVAFVQPDPTQFAFGFGRRACPGTEFAEASLLLVMAKILHRFVLECKDGQGSSAHNVQFTTGITSHIKPFPITFNLRDVNLM